MRCDGSTAHEKRFARRVCLPDVVDSLVSKIVRIVRSLAADRGLVVPLPSGIPVVVCERVEKEVGRSPTCRARLVVVVNGVCIEQLSRIVGVVTFVLQPDRQVVAI